MRLSTFLLVAPALAASTSEEVPDDAPDCTANTHAGYFDLRPDMAVPPEDAGKMAVTADYRANGWDMGYNFTMNICGGLVKPVEDVRGVDEELWRNVSAYYTYDGSLYSIGSESKALHTRGKKLVLQYTNGSPCGASARRSVPRDAAYEYEDYEDYEDDENYHVEVISPARDPDEDAARRKSTTISFLCDHDPIDVHAAVHFVGADPDECAYFFEVRSQHACASAEPHQPGSVGPGGVFALILLIALAGYFAGGVFYQRTVAHARGWRQLPNHTLWYGIWESIKDFAIIGASSCARLFPGRGGYSRVSRSPSGWRNRDDENRLIDQLDEEWDD